MDKDKEVLYFLIKAVKEASKLITDNFSVSQKGLENDLITNLDIDVEDYLISEIKRKYPDFDIVSEESNSKSQATSNCFVIDPIDGTINFANNLPFWGIQVACIMDSEVIAAAIYLPRMDELYYANKEGAYLNGTKINSNVVPIKNALYAIDGSDTIPIVLGVNAKGTGMRKFGAACVSMSFVSCGRLHGALFTNDKPWDYLPGLFIAKMAGAVILDKPGLHGAAMNIEFLNILENAAKLEALGRQKG